jgi:hypothetical protein
MRRRLIRGLAARRLPRGVPRIVIHNPVADRLIAWRLRRRAKPADPREMPPVH